MSHPSIPDLADLYAGSSGAAWRRIEREQPADYWEENIIAGRRRVRTLLGQWLAPVDGSTILDLGCGEGATASFLADLGARVTAVDAIPRFGAWRLEGRVRFVVGDLHQPVVDPRSFSAVLLQEVLGDSSEADQIRLLETIGHSPSARLVLVLPLGCGWQRWMERLGGKDVPRSEVDPVRLMRAVHLQTPYRLVRQQEVRRRNYLVRVAEFRSSQDGVGV